MRLRHPLAIHYVASIGFVTGVFLFQIDLPLVAAVLVRLLDMACNVDQLEVAFRILTFLLALVLEEEAVEVGQVDGLCPGPLESLLERGEDGAGLLNYMVKVPRGKHNASFSTCIRVDEMRRETP